jgi:signal transduction histidine kinase
LQPDCGTVLADATQLHQIGMNLVTNAYHAVQDKGGTITVEVRETELSEKLNGLEIHPGKYATLTVADTGIGILEKHMDKIFEPYFTTKEPGKGTGLGLSVVYGIIKEHQGEINVTSRPGKGTSFPRIN